MMPSPVESKKKYNELQMLSTEESKNHVMNYSGVIY